MLYGHSYCQILNICKNNPNSTDPTMRKNHPFGAKGGCMLDGKIYRENPCTVNPTFGELPFDWN